MLSINKINIRDIVREHWSTLKDDTTGSQANDVLLFYGVPVAAAAICALLNITLNKDAINVLTNALAIMAGLLFNLLVVLQGLAAANAEQNQRVREFAREVYNNIAYAIVASISALIPLAVAAGSLITGWVFLAASAVSIALVLHFALTMFMVLKRMHAMLRIQFK